MSTSRVCLDRLRKEFLQLSKTPLEHILAAPRESNLLEWHYVIEGAKGSCYEGGMYHGIVTFPPSYPFKPPSIQMLTPNGRFKTHTRLCLSMSDFHPESWNPMWSVGTILMGLLSFFLEATPTHGSIITTDAFKRKAALESLAFNCRDKTFCELFPALVELHEKQLSSRASGAGSSAAGYCSSSSFSPSRPANAGLDWTTVLAMLVFVAILTFFTIRLAL